MVYHILCILYCTLYNIYYILHIILYSSILENSMDRGGWQGTSSKGCKELDMTEHTRTQAQTQTSIILWKTNFSFY